MATPFSKIILIVLTIIIFGTNSSAQPANIKVATWYNFSKASYSLTFDDGLHSQYEYLYPVLEKYALKATFYIISGSLEENPERKPNWRFGYWHQFLEMASKGYEIGAHTVSHVNLTQLKDGKENETNTLQYELAEPIKAIREKLPDYQVVSFAYPFVAYNAHVKVEAEKYYLTARAAGGSPNVPGSINWGALQAYIIEYKEPRTQESDKKKIEQLQSFLEAGLLTEGGWSLLLAHDVMPFEMAKEAKDSWHPISLESFELFAQWLKNKADAKELWVAPVGAVTRYAKEIEKLKITEKEFSTTKLSYMLEDSLSDKIFNQPITLQIVMPPDWEKVKVKQGSKKEVLTVVDHKIIVHALPSADLLELFREY